LRYVLFLAEFEKLDGHLAFCEALWHLWGTFHCGTQRESTPSHYDFFSYFDMTFICD
jgi:hypothetical protein